MWRTAGWLLFLFVTAATAQGQTSGCSGTGTPEEIVQAMVEKSRGEIKAFRNGGGKDEDPDHPALRWAALLWECRAAYPGSRAASEATAEAVHILIHAASAKRALEMADSVPAEDQAWEKLVDFLQEAAEASNDFRGCVQCLERLLPKWQEAKLRARAQLMLARAYVRLEEKEQVAEWFEAVKREAPGTPFADQAEGGLRQLRALRPGQPAPLFVAQARDGSQVSLAGYRGRVVLLIFWSST